MFLMWAFGISELPVKYRPYLKHSVICLFFLIALKLFNLFLK